MKNNDIINIIVMALLAVVILGGTYFIVDLKVKTGVRDEILKIEYIKVGGKENFDFMTKSTIEQLTKYRKQFGESIGNNDSAGNNIVPEVEKVETITSISVEKASSLKEGAYIMGNPDAKISFIEYSDLECPFCKKLHQAGTIDEILKNYPNDVNFIFKHFPLGFHEKAAMEAEALECVGELGGSIKYYEFINEVFKNSKTNGNSFTKNTISDLAGTIGVDSTKVLSCIESGKYTTKVQEQMAEGSSFGVTGTPGNIIINNETGDFKLLSGAYPFANFKTIIDGFLSK